MMNLRDLIKSNVTDYLSKNKGLQVVSFKKIAINDVRIAGCQSVSFNSYVDCIKAVDDEIEKHHCVVTSYYYLHDFASEEEPFALGIYNGWFNKEELV